MSEFLSGRLLVPTALLSVFMLALLPACPSPTATSTGPKSAFVEDDQVASCRVEKDPDNPFVVEWQATSRSKMESMSKDGIIGVSYGGCTLKLLPNCMGKGKYVADSLKPQKQSLMLASGHELWANLPLFASSLEANIKAGRAIHFEYATKEDRKADTLTPQFAGRCEGLTHFVSSMMVGSYELSVMEQQSVGAGVSVAGAGAGAGGWRKQQNLGSAPETILQLYLVPVGASLQSSNPIVTPPQQPAWSPAPTPAAPPVQSGPKVASSQVTSAKGRLMVNVKQPANAYVEVKGPGGFKQSGGKQLDLPDIKPGSYTVSVLATGHEPFEQSVNVPADEVTPLNVSLDKLGGLQVTGTPVGAKVSVTGPKGFANEGGLPWSVADTWLGQYTVKVSREGYEPSEQSVTVSAGVTAKVTVNLTKGVTYGGGSGATSTGDGWIQVPGGTFMMGCSPGDAQCDNDEKPAHKVTLKGFRLMAKEVTQGQYTAVMGKNPSQFQQCGVDCPVEQVSWNDATSYCQKIGGRLPSEAEWEYAARAGSTGARYGDLNAIAWHGDNSGGKTHPVGKKSPNAWGFYDMIGNVWEWVNDWYGETYYASSPASNPEGPSSDACRVLRGGSWADNANNLRASNRFWGNPDDRYDDGFRCASN